jgi:tRNA(Ile)-lysidine synthase TilS/MesJ
MSRKDILEYLDSIGQDYVTDSTNLEDDVQRNKLRLDVIPMLEKVTPAANRTSCVWRTISAMWTLSWSRASKKHGKAAR